MFVNYRLFLVKYYRVQKLDTTVALISHNAIRYRLAEVVTRFFLLFFNRNKTHLVHLGISVACGVRFHTHRTRDKTMAEDLVGARTPICQNLHTVGGHSRCAWCNGSSWTGEADGKNQRKRYTC